MSETGGVDLGKALASARAEANFSLADLSAATFTSRGWINNVEAGRRWPQRDWIELADRELKTDGELLSVWELAKSKRDREAAVKGLLQKSERESRLLAAAQPDNSDLDTMNEAVADLAVAYLSNPPEPMLKQAASLREELTRRVTVGGFRPSEISDLYLALSRVSGVLAYAALDLGNTKIAFTHSAAAWNMADLAGDNELRAWTRGTQSLIARFDKDYELGRKFVDDGMRYQGPGTSEVRLLCGAAQCAANLGDSHTAMTLLAEADRARERSTSDSIQGLFGFSHAKQAYYSASSLMWLPDREALQIAASSAVLAIETWAHEPPEHRSLDDEALAQVYLATARLKLGEVEGAMDVVRTVLHLPEERRISWIVNRISDLSDLLGGDRFKNSLLAQDARDELRSYRV
ncbi:helix-turn-helix domain-containing protein [Kribbella qitaiheensis]|uniref:Helix-turn-helix domain-containing protein n=1 Tax=Kribbella qitaiheensis TaxID=1544730 RepID=A0A7G6X5X7_9ACTN|nr:helix-turn-helix transcriptional regulator [Kribbella qitaiheensis]QNE21642.1 helix-turn-helix domain-containing protein [Kribbella qitaiheensis]